MTLKFSQLFFLFLFPPPPKQKHFIYHRCFTTNDWFHLIYSYCIVCILFLVIIIIILLYYL